MDIKNWAAADVPSNTKWNQNPKFLLLVCGSLIGLNFPFAKLAAATGVPASLWILFNSMGALAALGLILSVQRAWRLPQGQQWRYVAIAGPITFAVPNIILYTIVPHVGAGYAGIMFSLSPVFTITLARLLGMDSLGKRRNAAIAIALIGAIGISLTRGELLTGTGALWLMLALAIPVVLASGNIYRSLDWPKHGQPELLAFWSHALTLLLYFSINLPRVNFTLFTELKAVWPLVMTQVFISCLTAPLSFRLQRYGGPVVLSQLGYVASIVGIFSATLFLGERYSPVTWAFAAVIVAGIALNFSAQESKGGSQGMLKTAKATH